MGDARPLRVLVVEDEALLALQLESFLEDEGHLVVGSAMASDEARSLADATRPDLALVDIHLADGPTGVDVGRYIARELGCTVVFMTANPKRVPDDFVGALGVIAKPYTNHGLYSALRFLMDAVRRPPPDLPGPASLQLAPAVEARWRA